LSVSRPRRLTIVQELIVALAIVGVTAHSVAVLAEGVDYLADAVAIGVFLLATSLSKHPPTPRRPLGYPKAAEIAALVNAGWLLALNVAVVFGASRRLLKGIPSELRQTPHLLPMSLRGGHSLQLNSLPYQHCLGRTTNRPLRCRLMPAVSGVGPDPDRHGDGALSLCPRATDALTTGSCDTAAG